MDSWTLDKDMVDRLGLAFCRLNCYEWDEIVGPKPEGYDELPDEDSFSIKKILNHKKYRRNPSKYEYIHPAIEAIKSIIGDANCSRCWWIYKLGRTEQEWFRWYCSEAFNLCD